MAETVFAYDIALEPVTSHTERKTWDGEWEKWIIERYGSIANVRSRSGYPAPRGEDAVATHLWSQVLGQWSAKIAGLDSYKEDSAAEVVIKSVDPNHMVSFRMAEAGNPTCLWGGIPYHFPYLAPAVDIFRA